MRGKEWVRRNRLQFFELKSLLQRVALGLTILSAEKIDESHWTRGLFLCFN